MLTLIYSNNEEAKIPIEHVNTIELTDRKKVIFVINNELNEYAVYNKIIIKIDKSINNEPLLLDSPDCETNIGQLLLRKDLVAIEYASNKKHKYYTNWNDANDYINLNQTNTDHDTYIEIEINNKELTMTKIILAAPCMGKTTYATNNPHIAIDLESSDYFFDKTGFEHLSSEEFKGIPNRKRNPNGVKDYLAAIKQAIESQKHRLIFTSSHPEVAKGIIAMGYDIHYIKPLPCEESENELIRRAKKRGNNENWINTTLPFIRRSPLQDFTSEELDHVHIHYVPPKSYLTDIIKQYNWNYPKFTLPKPIK